LFLDLPTGKAIHIAEMAHVFAATDDGPRAKPALTKSERGAFENLILLCSTCHTIIDKAPKDFPDSLILNWKNKHRSKLLSLFGAVECQDRQEARSQIDPLLRENKSIFDNYGPHIETAKNPESGDAERWKRKMLVKIIPNNRRILTHIDANTKLLRASEWPTVEAFRQHIDDLEARHIEGFTGGATQFPVHMNELFEG
tara:strand:+ start:373 stop:969 length:597 start_codon:yes stop_codon:yes gene_type:complete